MIQSKIYSFFAPTRHMLGTPHPSKRPSLPRRRHQEHTAAEAASNYTD